AHPVLHDRRDPAEQPGDVGPLQLREMNEGPAAGALDDDRPVNSPVRPGPELLAHPVVHVLAEPGKEVVEGRAVPGQRPPQQRLEVLDVRGGHSRQSGKGARVSGPYQRGAGSMIAAGCRGLKQYHRFAHGSPSTGLSLGPGLTRLSSLRSRSTRLLRTTCC